MVLQVGYNRRFDANFRAAREAVDDGGSGIPWLLRISSRDPAPPPADYLPLSGGLFLDTTSHDFDLALPRRRGDRRAPGDRAALADPHAKEIGDVDTAVVTLVFDNGAIGAIDNCRVSAYGYDQRVEVHAAPGWCAPTTSFDNVTVADADGFHARPCRTSISIVTARRSSGARSFARALGERRR